MPKAQGVALGSSGELAVWNGYLAFFLWILANRIGVPLPATPVLLAAGALAGLGELRFPIVLLLAVIATLVSDSVWYELGRRHGTRVLNLLCRLALEPDTCARRTENLVGRYGARALLVSKFVPGMNRAILPLTGSSRVGFPTFLAFDIVGAALWASGYAGLGYIFSEQLEQAAKAAPAVSFYVAIAAAFALGPYIAWKFFRRRAELKREFSIARITPEDLTRRLEAGEPITVVDLRHPLDSLTDPRTLPGALRISPEELQQRHQEIPRDREVILYCT